MLATAAAAAAEGGLFAFGEERDCWKATDAPCRAEAFREAGEVNRGFAAISPFMEANTPTKTKDTLFFLVKRDHATILTRIESSWECCTAGEKKRRR